MKKLSLFLIVLSTLVISGCNPRPTGFRTVEINEKYSENKETDSVIFTILLDQIDGQEEEAQQKVIRDKIRAFCKTKNLNELKAGYCSGFGRTFTITSSPGSRSSPRKILNLSFLLSDIGSETNLKELSRDLESFIEELKKETPSLFLSAHIGSDLGENPQETIIALRSKTIESAKKEAEDIVQSIGGKLGKVVSIREADFDFSGKTMIELNEFIRGPYTAEGFKHVTLTSKMIVQFEIVD